MAASLQNPREFFFARTSVAGGGGALSEQRETVGSTSVPRARRPQFQPRCVLLSLAVSPVKYGSPLLTSPRRACGALEEYSAASRYFACHLLPFFFFFNRNSGYSGKHISR